MKYPLRNGYTVTTAKLPGDRTEFTTRSKDGQVVSTVDKGREAARELIIGLRAAVCLRRI